MSRAEEQNKDNQTVCPLTKGQITEVVSRVLIITMCLQQADQYVRVWRQENALEVAEECAAEALAKIKKLKAKLRGEQRGLRP